MFKSKEQLETEARMQKMQSIIFPGGKEQVENELRQIRTLLDFRYTQDETYKTYMHAVAIYFLSTEKDKEEIVCSILQNPESVVTKVDAEKIFYYIQAKQQIRQTQQSSYIDREKALMYFGTAENGIALIDHFYKLNNKGKFEVLIFNSIIALNNCEKNENQKYSILEKEYFDFLHEKAEMYGLSINSKFIDSRFLFYTNELNKITTKLPNYIPSKIYYTFFKNPLTENIKDAEEIFDIMAFHRKLIETINWVNENSSK